MKKLLLYLVLFTSVGSGANGDPVLPDFSNWPVFDAKAFGAVGNGVADDRTAFAAALQAVKAAGKGIVSIPAGTTMALARKTSLRPVCNANQPIGENDV
jgi:hypothetical protein